MRRVLITPTAGLALALLASLGPGCAGCGDPVDPGPDLTPSPNDDDTPEIQYDRGYYLDMALDAQGRVWLAYRENERGVLQVARGSGDPVAFNDVWTVDGQPDTSGPIPVGGFQGGYYASIAVDSAGAPHVAHWNQEDGGLRYATLAGDVWSAEDVETGEVGQFTDIVLVDGRPLIAYYDYDAGAQKVARKTDTGWQDEVVDAGSVGPDATEAGLLAPDVGPYANLLVDSAGVVWLAYFDRANGDLKVVRGGFGAWTPAATFGAGANTGAWPVLSEGGGGIWVAFQDLDTNTLWFGNVAGGTVVASQLDPGAFTGADSAVVWIDGSAILLYQDAQTNDVKKAVRDPQGNVTLSTFLADGAVGFHNNVEVDGTGRLNFACFDHTRTNFHFQRALP